MRWLWGWPRRPRSLSRRQHRQLLALKRDIALREFFLAKAEEFKTAAYRTGLQADQDPEFAKWQRDYHEWMGEYRERALAIDDNSDLIGFGNRFQMRVAGEIADRALYGVAEDKQQVQKRIAVYDHS